MTQNQVLRGSVLGAFCVCLHLVLDWDVRRTKEHQSYPYDNDVYQEVKREYTISCTAGQTMQDEYYTCADVKRFIDKMEGKYRPHVTNIPSSVVSESKF